jgi:hypothetical protein
MFCAFLVTSFLQHTKKFFFLSLVTTEDWFNIDDDDKTKKPTTTESSAGKPANQTLPDSEFKNYDEFYYDQESAGAKTRSVRSESLTIMKKVRIVDKNELLQYLVVRYGHRCFRFQPIMQTHALYPSSYRVVLEYGVSQFRFFNYSTFAVNITLWFSYLTTDT